MKNLKKTQIVLIVIAVAVLLMCVSMTAFLLFSNYQTVRLFKQAQRNFQRGDFASLEMAEAQLLQLIKTDADNEEAFIMLGSIAQKKKIYPEQVYFCHMAYRLNPLSSKNKEQYLRSLLFARSFGRLEHFLAQESSLSEQQRQLLFYAAGRNGNSGKYKQQLIPENKCNTIGKLAILLHFKQELSAKEKLAALKKLAKEGPFSGQELLAAEAELYLEAADLENSEKALVKAWKLNPFAFAPALGRFYANFRSFGKALHVFEKYLETYHDQAVAMQCAEIYCLLKDTSKISKLRARYQGDDGKSAMLCCYYFDALTALAKNDIPALKELSLLLRGNIKTPLARFMFLNVALFENDVNDIFENYRELLALRSYVDLQSRADRMVSLWVRNSLNTPEARKEFFLPLVEILHKRSPDAFTAKIILLAKRSRGTLENSFLEEALKRFAKDKGVLKIGIEHYLDRAPQKALALIASYRKLFPESSGDMLRYEIISAIRRKDHSAASKLFQKNFSQNIRHEYWTFASSARRSSDLQFLSRDPVYRPFCQALLLLLKGEKDQACTLLENADAKGNLSLLFFAARTLGENGRNQAALKKYAQFPPESPYKTAVLLNTSELLAEEGELPRALILAQQAYQAAPLLPEAQLCYADKLSKSGKLAPIADIVTPASPSPYRKKMEELWKSSMEHRIRESDLNSRQEKIRELCRTLLTVDPRNKTALDHLKKLNRMRQ